MKRDPVLAQLDFLINGPSKTVRTEQPNAEPAPEPQPPPLPPPLPSLAPDPVLAQLDALINGAPAAIMAASSIFLSGGVLIRTPQLYMYHAEHFMLHKVE